MGRIVEGTERCAQLHIQGSLKLFSGILTRNPRGAILTSWEPFQLFFGISQFEDFPIELSYSSRYSSALTVIHLLTKFIQPHPLPGSKRQIIKHRSNLFSTARKLTPRFPLLTNFLRMKFYPLRDGTVVNVRNKLLKNIFGTKTTEASCRRFGSNPKPRCFFGPFFALRRQM